MGEATRPTGSNGSTTNDPSQAPAAGPPIPAFQVTGPPAVQSPASSFLTPEVIDALQRGYSDASKEIIAFARESDGRLDRREILRIVFGGIALLLLAGGLVGLTIWLIALHEYGAAVALFGTGTIATAIGNLGDRMLSR